MARRRHHPALASALVVIPLGVGLLVLASAAAAAPDTIFGSATPATVDSGDSNSVELGVKFSSEVAGSVTGIRFYKAATNTGTHIASLWSASGTQLASATFTGESASGWQQISFSTPVQIAANTTYIAAYLAPKGHYSDTSSAFASAAVNNPPLKALANTTSANGVYAYSTSSTFPTNTYKATNYWVDVDFEPTPATAPGQVTKVSATPGVNSATLTWNAPTSGGAVTKYTITPYTGTSAQPTTTVTGSPPATTATITELKNTSSYTFTVTASNSTGTGPTSEPSNTITPTAPTPAPSSTAAPQVTGTTTQGQTLTTSNGSWSGNPGEYAYAWRDCDSTGESCATIAGASSSSYTLSATDVGDTVVAAVTATNAGGSATAASTATAVIEPSSPSAPVNTGAPLVTGTVATGQTLTTSSGTWTNAPTSFSYQWQDCEIDGSGCSNIAGAISSTYTLTAGDAGHTLTALVTAANASGSASASASPVPLVDEFNGSSVQTGLWTVMDQQGDTSNGELECYLPSRVAESGGFLTETLISHSVTCPAGTPHSSNPLPYESGAVQMKSVSFTYGTVVVRAKMGSGSSGWPAIWLLGASCQQPNWLTEPSYSCGWPSNASDAAEIDIAEIKGANTGTGTVWQNLITSGGTQTCLPSTTDTSANYHTYELEWTPASLSWRIDGTKTCQFTSNVPTTPMFMIINTAQAGGSLSEPQVTSVDYAHISFGAAG
jgi:beta-glucanase (GH16 family)